MDWTTGMVDWRVFVVEFIICHVARSASTYSAILYFMLYTINSSYIDTSWSHELHHYI